MATAMGVWQGRGDHTSLSADEWGRAEKLLEGHDMGAAVAIAAPSMAHAEVAKALMGRANGATEQGDHRAAEGLRQRAVARQVAQISGDRKRDDRGRFA